MRQRAALIRTLALDPDILLLDEPFSALDYQTRLAVCDDISSIIRENRKTAVLVTHDLAEAVSAADRILILTRRPGRIKTVLPITFAAVSSMALIRYDRRAEGKPPKNAVESIIDERFDDARMEKIYPNALSR